MMFINNLKGYTVDFTPAAKKELKKLDFEVRRAILEKLNDLASGKQHLKIKKLEKNDPISSLSYCLCYRRPSHVNFSNSC